MKKLILLLFIVFFTGLSQAEEITYMFRLLLSDKGESPCSIDQPLQFLSQKAIDRRNKQNIEINETDLPIDPAYLFRIESLHVSIVAQSKWLNTVTVKTTDSLRVDALRELPFVDTLCLVYRSVLKDVEEDVRPENPLIVTSDSVFTNTYGEAFSQIAMHNGNLLHEKGYRGEGLTIAVMDGGFYNADCIDAFNQDHILGVKNFSHITAHPFRIKQQQHGTLVLSTMLSNKPTIFVGTAPEADYYLFCSEVNGEEFPVEEDYWISAIEYADSIGIDISTASLGYTVFDDMPEMSHTQEQLDGKTTLISRAATMAAEKGILVLNAAGNEGNKEWSTITFPSDANKIITVGSVLSDSSLSSFTPYGPTKDGRIKPDVMAIGTQTSLIGSDGAIRKSNGTSYATPVVCGLMACLWESLPDSDNQELIRLVQESSNKFSQPDDRYGYGIPDVFKAFEHQATSLSDRKLSADSLIRVVGNYLLITVDIEHLSNYHLTIYNVLGKNKMTVPSLSHTSIDISSLPQDLYIAHLIGPGVRKAYKFIRP